MVCASAALARVGICGLALSLAAAAPAESEVLKYVSPFSEKLNLQLAVNSELVFSYGPAATADTPDRSHFTVWMTVAAPSLCVDIFSVDGVYEAHAEFSTDGLAPGRYTSEILFAEYYAGRREIRRRLSSYDGGELALRALVADDCSDTGEAMLVPAAFGRHNDLSGSPLRMKINAEKRDVFLVLNDGDGWTSHPCAPFQTEWPTRIYDTECQFPSSFDDPSGARIDYFKFGEEAGWDALRLAPPFRD